MKRVFTIPERTHGPGPVFLTWQRSHANYLVTTGYDHSIIIHDRHGDRVDSINLPGSCSGLSWDFEGAMLAAICDRSPLIFLWDSSTHRLSKVDTAVRDILTLLVWSKKTHLLAVGTSKGNILIYNHQTSRKVPILGKHAKKINSGCWSDQNMLALTGDDRLLTVSNEEGDTICQCDLKGEASLVHFSKLQNRDGKAIFNQECVSLVLNKRNLFILNINDPDRPYVLEFREKYGKIIDYQWFGEGNILVGFSSGLIVVISTLTKKMGQELATVRAHQENLIALTASISTKRVASCSENVIKFFDIDQLEDIKSVLVLEDEKAIEWMEWTDDGQLIALASSSGAVHVYLTKLTILGSSFGTRIAYLSSLLELTVASVSEDLEDSLSVLRIDVEPSLIAVGPYHVATCINNRAWFYSLMRNENQLFIKEKEYPSILKSIKINGDYVAALFTDGKLQLHSIDEANTGDLYGDRDVKVFHGGESSKISSISLTNEFLIYGTESGLLEFFSLEDWSMVNVHRHTSSIKFLEPDCSGLRLIAIDSQNQVFLYNSINGTSIVLKDPEDFPANIRKIFWESWSPNKGVFIISDERTLFIYSYVRDSIYDQTIEFVGRMKIPINQYPLMLYNGVIVCQTESGKTSTFLLSTHDLTDKMNDHSRLRSEFLRDILKLRRYQDAWKICESLDEPGAWKELGKQAMIDMDISFALRVYRKIQDAGMVYSLESLKNVEERNLIAGWMAQYLGDFDLAQKMFLSSSKPREALEMRQNLQDWDAALLLANRLSKESIPLIAREYAGQLEFQGDYRNALDNFEKACQFGDDDEDPESNPELSNHIQLCKAGIARTSIKCGDIKKGMKAVLELSNNQSLLLECASILEASKHYPEAAKLYELGENFEKSAKIYMNLRDNQKVGEIISKSSIKNSDLIARYARVKETESNYQEAISLYLRAGDHLNAVRLLLDKINDPGEAARIVRENKSTEGAKMMARFFQRINDIDSAIEFLVISNFNEEAFQLAVSTGQVDTYANVLMNAHESGTNELVVEDFHSLAVYYDQNKSPLRAGKFYCLAKKYSKGVKLLLQSISSGGGDEKEAMKIVINAASKSKDEQVIRTVIDFLMGESDGEPKDFKYLFRLYMALRQFKEAAQTAIVISKEEQNAGNYRNAHDLLFAMSKELLKQNIPIPMEMESSLLLIHSYLLAKAWIKIGDHLKSAQLLIRVSKNISKFPSHIVPILTSTVIECQRSGLKTQAFNYATMLMKPEYRDKIEPKIKRKIEALVRKSIPKTPESSLGLEIISKMSPCPHCGQDLLEIELICGQCRGNIPFCLATGYHITQKDLTSCPSCQFPAIRAYFNDYLEVENVCPMCYSHVESKDLKEEDITRFLKS